MSSAITVQSPIMTRRWTRIFVEVLVLLCVSCSSNPAGLVAAEEKARDGGNATRVSTVHGFGTTTVEQLAAKEILRYWTLLTGRRPAMTLHGNGTDVSTVTTLPHAGSIVETIVLVTQGHNALDQLRLAYPSLDAVLNASSHEFLQPQQQSTRKESFVLQHVVGDDVGGRSLLCVVGATPTATLYAAYELLRRMGVFFSLEGDAVPELDPNLTLPTFAGGGKDVVEGSIPITATPPNVSGLLAVPNFASRGLQPFHDFPMGPDWWQPEFWKALQSQMAKLQLNFLGFHTYPIGPIVEPAVWVGTVDGFVHVRSFDVSREGTLPWPALCAPRLVCDLCVHLHVVFVPHRLHWDVIIPPLRYDALGSINVGSGAYQSSWYLTQNFDVAGTNATRGNVPGQVSTAASTFCCGAAQAFPRDCYGSDAQADICFPTTATESAAVFDKSAALLRDAFRWGAHAAGVDAALGVEVPLTGPDGHPPATAAELHKMYAGIFGRLVAAQVPLTRFWLWTSENVEDHSTGKGYPQSNPLWAALVAEFEIALAALAETPGANFSLGTNGWCLGPGDNASYFGDAITDPTFGVGAINGALGWLPPDPAFAQVEGPRATAIPWMEDDLALNSVELWVNRTLAHAGLAAQYGVTGGLLGLLWRTFETSPQISALSRAGWNFTRVATTLTAARAIGDVAMMAERPLTDRIVYRDFCASNFGDETADTCADLFLNVDGVAPGTSVRA